MNVDTLENNNIVMHGPADKLAIVVKSIMGVLSGIPIVHHFTKENPPTEGILIEILNRQITRTEFYMEIVQPEILENLLGLLNIPYVDDRMAIRVVKQYRKQLLEMNLKKEERFTVANIFFDPRALIVLENCLDVFTSLANTAVLEAMLSQHDRPNITTIFSLSVSVDNLS